MKKKIFKTLSLILLLMVLFTAVSCDKLPFNPFSSNSDKDKDSTNAGTTDNSDDLTLIENGKAKFQVVFTEASAESGALIADMFVNRLKTFGALPKNAMAVSDSDAEKVENCEIIIGAEAQNRGDECSISTKYLGENGEAVKIVGNRVIIATGSHVLLKNRFDSFVRNQLGISSSATSIDDKILIERSYKFEKLTQYLLESISINGVDMREYTLVVDVRGMAAQESVANIDGFRSALYDASGYWLELGSVDKIDTYDKTFVIRRTEDAGESGFRAYVEENGNVIVECAYDNAFNGAFGDFTSNTFTNHSGSISLNYDYRINPETNEKETVNFYEKTVSIAYYEDFGAVGDGKTCSFEAIYNTHVYANRGGQKVMSRNSESTYYISPEKFTKSIPVKTDVDLNGSTIIVDDRGSAAFQYYVLGLFSFTRDNPTVTFNDTIKNVPVVDAKGNPVYNEKTGLQEMTVDGTVDDERFHGIKLMNKTDENALDPNVYQDFSWLAEAGVLKGKSFVRVYNKLHRDFIRHGSNQNSGSERMSVFIVYEDGTIDSSTPIVFDFENISKIEISSANDKPITFENGKFVNICCRTVSETTYTTPSGVLTKYACKYKGYHRGLDVSRANVTVKNLIHSMEEEPMLGYIPAGSGYKSDALHKNYGSRHESYPYHAFFYLNGAYNFHVYDTQLTGHTTYYEDKPATASTGGKIPNPVPMGSYDFVINNSSHVYFDNVKQVNSSSPNSGIADGRYWGIMSSNGSRNMFFNDCVINRFDAHAGFWNAELYNTVIGHSFHVVGGGYLIAENVTKVTKNAFIAFRGDYGATFNGDITLKNCHHQGFETYDTARGGKNTTLNDQYRRVRSRCVIFESGYSADNAGWVDEENYSGAYWMWNFGYTCYMPRNIVIDNFTYGSDEIAVFSYLPDEVFEKSYEEGKPVTPTTVRYPYQITESITFKNTETLPPLAFDENATRLLNIPTTCIKNDEEEKSVQSGEGEGKQQ
ncbi:MAG: hypothetical protein E7673_00455 [Ruminococcaceae bacterium]|nr:hypothetical protein [Oscillospiraceae bacterium]